MSTLPPPTLDDASVAETARQRLIPKRKKKARISISLPNLKTALRRPSKPKLPEPETVVAEEDLPAATEFETRLSSQRILCKDSLNTGHDQYKDVYRWAVLYENQRGMTVFSTPLYSRSALLPADPAPFTVPSSSSQSRSHLPDISLTEYPLPDGNWHWVSKAWMVDMRHSGEVQYDGFEYNWRFRKHKWRPEVGPLSAGGWVRRRRWIRLMMRPGKQRNVQEEASIGGDLLSPLSASSLRSSWNGESFDTRRLSDAPSILSASTNQEQLAEILEIWSGNVEEDWKMCKQLMKMVGRSDGGRLELWKRWLGSVKNETSGDKSQVPVSNVSSSDLQNEDSLLDGVPKVSEADVTDGASSISTNPHYSHSSEEAPEMSRLDCVKAVLDAHTIDILGLFVYPETKRQFIELLNEAGIHLGNLDGSLYKALQFHSLASGLNLQDIREEDQGDKDDEE